MTGMAFVQGGAEAGTVGRDGGGGEAGAGERRRAAAWCSTSQTASLSRKVWITSSECTALGDPHFLRKDHKKRGDL